MKIYAKQVAPEYQESPLFMWPDMWPEHITITGNQHFNAHETPLFEMIYKTLEAGAAGGDPADVVLYKFTGWTRRPEYGEAC